MRGGCPLARVFQRLPSLAYAFANSSGRSLGTMFNSTARSFGTVFNGFSSLFRRVLIVLSQAKRDRQTARQT
jgi:hypothetical protein